MLDTNTRVGAVSRVHDKNGMPVPPASADKQSELLTRMQALEAALRSQAGDALLVDSDNPLDVSAATVNISPPNHSGVTAFAATPNSTSQTALPSHSVPPGVSVLVMAQKSNSSSNRVYLGDSGSQPIPLRPEASVSLDVADTSAIHIRTPNSGDGVGVMFES